MKNIVICIGNELLRGDRVNTNASMICSKLAKKGLNVSLVETVGDERMDISDALKRALKAGGLTVVSGGLGPTVDDITVDAAAYALGVKTHINRKVFSEMRRRMKRADDESVTRMSTFMDGSSLIKNRAGAAYGQLMKKGGSRILFVPGVPEEAAAVLDEFLSSLPEIRRKNPVFALAGIGETSASAKLSKCADRVLFEKLSFYPSHSGVKIVIDREKYTENETLQMERIIKSELGYYIFSRKDERLMDVFHRTMIKKGLTFSTAESCTGGMVSKLITDRAGSSAYFKGGYTAYSNEMKVSCGLVSRRVLEKYGAVSAEAAESMSRNAAESAGADASAAITGIAGPGGGSREKRVGLVYISTFYKGKAETWEYNFPGSRENVRKFSAYYAVFHILRRVKDE